MTAHKPDAAFVAELVDAVRHDAEIELGREDGDCVLTAEAYHEGVLTLAAEVERLRDVLMNAPHADSVFRFGAGEAVYETWKQTVRKALNG